MYLICRYNAAYFAYCPECRQYAVCGPHDSCFYCGHNISALEYQQLKPTPLRLGVFNEYQLVHWLRKQEHITQDTSYFDAVAMLSRVVLQPNNEPVLLQSGYFMADRIAAAKQLYICSPKWADAPYWDYPGTVGIADSIFERHCLIDGEVLLRLECGPAGRCFVRKKGLDLWLTHWQKTLYASSLMPDEVELDLQTVFWKGSEPPKESRGISALLLTPDALTLLPGRVPLGGFEFGMLRRVPENYYATLNDPSIGDQRELLAPYTFNWTHVKYARSSGLPEQPVPEYVKQYWGEALTKKQPISNAYTFFGLRMYLIHKYESHLQSGVAI